jgi:hypothetical protein
MDESSRMASSIFFLGIDPVYAALNSAGKCRPIALSASEMLQMTSTAGLVGRSHYPNFNHFGCATDASGT